MTMAELENNTLLTQAEELMFSKKLLHVPLQSIALSLRNMSGKSALIIGSNGSEDIELVITSDVLRRANIQVIIAGLQDEKIINCAKGTSINVDKLLNDVIAMDFDAVILPGGEVGSQNLADCKRVGEILRRHEKNGSIVAAICAAPVALAIHGIGKGGRLTSYPSAKDLIVSAGYEYSEENVCVCKNVVTSRGPGTTFEFAMMLVQLLTGEEKRQMLSNKMLLK